VATTLAGGMSGGRGPVRIQEYYMAAKEVAESLVVTLVDRPGEAMNHPASPPSPPFLYVLILGVRERQLVSVEFKWTLSGLE